MQAQSIQEDPAETVAAHPRPAALQPKPQQTGAQNKGDGRVSGGELSPARILADSFEDLRRKMATLEGRIVEGSNTGEVARIAQMLERVEERLSTGTAPRRAGARVPVVALLVLIAFGAGIVAADRSPYLRDGSQQIVHSAANFWQAASDRVTGPGAP